MYSYIDTHAHLYAEEFREDISAVIMRARAAGCCRILLPNIDAASIQPMLALCDKEPHFFAPMLGLHPTELPHSEVLYDTLAEMELRLQQSDHPYVAIGEVGIDLYWDTTRYEEQVAVFRTQIEWASKYSLPLMIHVRKAHREVVQTLVDAGAAGLSGVFHCFGGTQAEAEELLTTFPHFALGIGGVLTFKRSSLPQVLQDSVPLDRIVLETDAPYLAPTPHRGGRNESSYLPYVIAQLAITYGVDAACIAQQTTSTTHRIFTRLCPECFSLA